MKKIRSIYYKFSLLKLVVLEHQYYLLCCYCKKTIIISSK